MATIIRDQKAGLSTLVRTPDEGKAEQLIMLLHGWGADAADLMELAPALTSRFPQAVFAAPDGPAPCSANPMGRQWFDLGGGSIDAGPYEAQPMLAEAMAELLADHHLEYSQAVLIGFSQGGMMALHVSLRLPQPIAAVVSFSGALLAPEKLEAEKTATPPVMLIHGEADEVVPVQALTIADAVLKANAVDVETVPLPGLGHGIDANGLEQACRFMDTALSS